VGKEEEDVHNDTHGTRGMPFLSSWIFPARLPWANVERHKLVRVLAFAFALLQAVADVMTFAVAILRTGRNVWSLVSCPALLASSLIGVYGAVRCSAFWLFVHSLSTYGIVLMILVTVLYDGIKKSEWTRAYTQAAAVIDIVAAVPSLMMAVLLARETMKRERVEREAALAAAGVIIPTAASAPAPAPAPVDLEVESVATAVTASADTVGKLTPSESDANPASKPEPAEAVAAAPGAPSPPSLATAPPIAVMATTGDEPKCIVCFENDRCMAFYKCGHSVMCEACAYKLLETSTTEKARCPVCRQEILEMLKLYK
jgi:hypothetical protein